MTSSAGLGSAVGFAIALVCCPAMAQEPQPSPSPAQAEPSSPPPSSAEPAPPAAGPANGAPQKLPWWKRYGANDKRRTMRSYPANFVYNIAGVVTPGNRRNLAAAALLGATTFPYDDDVQGYFEKHPHDRFGRIGQFMGGGIVVGAMSVGFFSFGRMAPWDRFRCSTYDLSQAILVNMAYTFALKETVRRERPNHSDRLSFPSGHASNAFAAAAVLERHYGWKAGVPAYGVATFIAFSRLAAEKHHFSDITVGAALGFGVGRTVVRRNSRPPTPPGGPTPPSVPPKDEKRLDVWFGPDRGPAGDGVGARLSLTF